MRASVLLVGVLCLGESLAPAGSSAVVAPRILRRRVTSPVLRTATRTANCNGQTTSCLDCSTVLTCARVGVDLRPVSNSTCPTATPYCSAGTCVATTPDEDDDCNQPPLPSANFVCNGDGYFPDPANCRRYYLCVDAVAYEYDCTSFSNTVYSHARSMCVRSSEATCSTVTCNSNRIGTYQLYGQDNSVYFVCTDTTAANAYVAACPENYEVDSDGNCILTCMREGRLPNTRNPNSYYECIQTGTNTFRGPIPATCPIGATFNAPAERCVDNSTITDLNSRYLN